MDAFEKNFEQQLETARLMMEAPGVKIHVFGVAIRNNEGMLARSVSEGTTRREAAGIVGALEHEIARIRALLKAGAR